MGKMNSESISRFQVSRLNYYIDAIKIAHRRTCSMFQILFMNQCYPMETESSKFSKASWKDFPYRSSKFLQFNLMSSQKASNIENI